MTKRYCIIFVLALIVLENSLTLAKSQPRKPKSVEPLLWCNSCQAIVREMLKKLGTKTKEYQVS